MIRQLRARLRALIHILSTPLSTPAGRRMVRIGAHVATVLLMLSVPAAAYADSGGTVVLAANSLPVVIANLRNWIMGILAAVATLFLVLAGVYWATAGGDPAQVDKAKGALKNALVGYGLAVLAPILLQIVEGIVGKPQ
jgi:type IV secretion system pilin